ncbi:MAG: family 10 glycosylhydrolase [Bacteroidaceae bacterium]|nr:family 10 glycosylhydrolase [Bacteroidaceae bacterium]
MKHQIITFICFVAGTLFCQAEGLPSSPKREVRAVWITTLSGLDWPRTKARTATDIERQKQELCDMLDQLQAAHFNTILLQTRIRSTVIYPSAIEPWDGCLTGQAGRDPGYDPLKFAIEECHKRKMELHAWLVAFPGMNTTNAKSAGKRKTSARWEKFSMLTSNGWMLDPGEPETANYLADLCEEITANYDIDGIHLDYLRYPEKEVKYNDTKTYNKYGKGQNLATWRRANVTHCMRTIHDAVKRLKPWVRVSCSPIGKSGDLRRFSSKEWNAYAAVHQDVKGWLREGLVDMIVPMMYFQGNHFYPFLADWVEHSEGRMVVPGLGAYLLKERNWPLEVLEREDYVSRQMGAHGQAYFRSRFVTGDTKGLYSFLRKNFYTTPAFTPALTWEKATPPDSPKSPHIIATPNGIELHWEKEAEEGITYNIYRSATYPVDISNINHLMEYGLHESRFSIPMMLPETMLPYYTVTAMDRYGNESIQADFNQPIKADMTWCTNWLQTDGNCVILPSATSDEYLMVTDITQRAVMLTPYKQQIDCNALPPGIYTFRTLGKKGRTHLIGRLIKNGSTE